MLFYRPRIVFLFPLRSLYLFTVNVSFYLKQVGSSGRYFRLNLFHLKEFHLDPFLSDMIYFRLKSFRLNSFDLNYFHLNSFRLKSRARGVFYSFSSLLFFRDRDVKKLGSLPYALGVGVKLNSFEEIRIQGFRTIGGRERG